MSTHLLPVKTGNEQMPVQYRRIQNIEIACGCCLEYDSILYILMTNSMSGGNHYIYRMNLFTGEMVPYATFTSAELYQSVMSYAGQFLMDDKYLYLLNATGTIGLVTFELRNMDELYDPATPLPFVTKSSLGSPYYISISCYGKMVWFNDHTIAIPYSYGFILYDTTKRMFSKKIQSASYNIYDIAKSDSYIMLTTNNATVLVYDIKNDLFTTIQIPNTPSSTPCVTYNPEQHKFYFVATNYLYIYDEVEQTFEEPRNVPWTKPYDVKYTMNTVYVICNNSNFAYVYDIKSHEHFKITLPWTIGTYWDSDRAKGMTYPCATEGFWFIPRYTLGIIDYTGYSKYNFGYKYSSETIMFGKQTMEQFIYDNRFVSFDETFMSVHDGIITYPLEIMEEDTRFKIATIHKSDYKFINQTNFR